MSDLFKKLNFLLKSRLNDVLGENPLQRSSFEPKRLGKDLDREIEYLRNQINEAVAYEEDLQAKVETISQDAERIDREADKAVAQGDDAQARRLISQLQRKQQYLTIAQADLREHQVVTQDLIQRVNLLDSVVSEAKSQQQHEASEEVSQLEENANQSQSILSNVLRDTREKIVNIGENITTLTNRVSSNEDESTSLLEEEVVDDTNVVNDDLEKRRQRLSKPK